MGRFNCPECRTTLEQRGEKLWCPKCQDTLTSIASKRAKRGLS